MEEKRRRRRRLSGVFRKINPNRAKTEEENIEEM
jgi:hypothetical protein